MVMGDAGSPNGGKLRTFTRKGTIMAMSSGARGWLVGMVGLIALVLGGCGPQVTMEVRAVADPEADLSALSRFAISHQLASADRTDHLDRQVAESLQGFLVRYDYLPVREQPTLIHTSAEALRLKQVAAVVRDELARNGYAPDPKDPHFLVSVDYSTGPYEYFVPGRVVADDGDEVTATRIRGLEDGRPYTGVAEQVEGNPMVTPGRRALTHVNAVAVYVYPTDDRREAIWRGSAVSVDYQPDFERVLPVLVAQILGEFPHPTGEPRRRTVALPETAGTE